MTKSLADITDPKLRSSLSSIQEAMAQRQPKQTLPAKAKSAEVIQLPLWPDPARGVPNSALRGALFAAIQGKNRRALKGELLAVQQGMEIRFTGWQLDQSDLDVWEQCLHLARMHPLGTRCDFTAHAFLKALGRGTGKAQHEWLKDVFRRLAGAVAEITHNHMTYGASLLEFYRDEITDLYRLEINPKIKALYDAGWTACDWHQRQLLRRKPLALWLHGFLASHAKPFPMKIETLRNLSGSKTKEIWKFKQNLIKALEDLKAIGFITDYDITGGLVTINRTPSASQKKHLTKAKPRTK